MKTVILLGLISLTIACTPPPPDPADFDNSCTVVDDCVPVYAGDPCQQCQCANATVTDNAYDEWQEAQVEPFCMDDLLGYGVECLCAAPVLVCNDGQCAIDG